MRSTAAVLVVVAGLLVGGCSVPVRGTAAAVPGGAAAATTTAGPTSTWSAPSPSPSSPAPAPPGSYVDGRDRFRLVPPPGWTTDPSGTQGTEVVFLDDAASGQFTANINVLVVRSGADLPTTVVGARQELRGLGEYSSTADEPVTLDDGTSAHLLGGTFTDAASGLELRNQQLFTVDENTTVVVTGTALAGGWASAGPLIERALRTLTVAA